MPDFVSDQLSWGAGPRAVQFLILGAKARALLHGRTHVSTDDIQALAKPVLRHRLVVNFTAESDGVTPDDIVDRLLADHPHQRRRTDQRCPLPKDFCILRRSSASRGSTCALATSSKGFLSGMHRSPVLRPVGRVPAAPRVHARRRPAPRRLESLGQARPLLRQAVRGRHEPARPRCWSTCRAACATAAGPLNKYEYGCTIAASAWPTCCCGSRTPSAAWPSTRRFAPTVPHAHQAEPSELDHPSRWPRASREQKTDLLPILRDAAETYPRRGMMILISDLLVDRAGLFKGLKLLRQRGHDVLVFHVMDDDELDFPFSGPTRFEGLELPEHLTLQSAGLARRLPGSAWTRILDEVRRGCATQRSRLRAAAHQPTAGCRAGRVSEQSARNAAPMNWHAVLG